MNQQEVLLNGLLKAVLQAAPGLLSPTSPPTAYEIAVNTSNGQKHISVAAGKVTFIAGPNGVGKSSLLHDIARGMGGQLKIETFSGHRQISFNTDDTDNIGVSFDQLRQNMMANWQQYGRTRSMFAEQHLKSVVKRLINRQNQNNNDLVSESEKTGRRVAELAVDAPRTTTVLNRVFDIARLAVHVDLHDGILKAERAGEIYGLDALSDGERAALLLVGAVLIQPKSGFIAIDEPEKHLNPSISGPLIAAAVRARPDLGYLFSSHDLQLIDWLSPSSVVHIRNSTIVAPGPIENRVYDLDILHERSDLPDDLRRSILGARRAILLIEGEEGSDDKALYSLVYPERLIIPRGGADSVISSVRALSKSAEHHWLSAQGILDGDGRQENEVQALQADGIWCLPVPTIENLFLSRDIVAIMAEVAYSFIGGRKPSDTLIALDSLLTKALAQERESLSLLRTVWQVNRTISAQKISVRDLRSGACVVPEINISLIRESALQLVDSLLSDGNPFEAVRRLPIKNTPIPNVIAREAGYANFRMFKQSLLQQMQSGSTYSRRLMLYVNDVLPKLPSA